MAILSTKCLCRSVTFWPESASSSAADPTQIMSSGSSSFTQIGMHEPQKRLRETFQSRAPSSQFSKRFSPTYSGIHATGALFFAKRSWRSSTRMYHAGIAR